MTVMPDDYTPPAAPKPKPRRLKPAMRLAMANPGRWVLMTELSTAASAVSRSSALRRDFEAHSMPYEVARDGTKVMLRYVPEKDPRGARPQPVEGDDSGSSV